MKLLDDFKAFAMKGNAIDMAVGIIIGAAFGKIVSSLVGDVLMPPLGALIGGVDFSSFAITIKAATENSPAVMINYGKFIQTVIDFLIVAFSIFMMVKCISKIEKKMYAKADAAPAPEPKPTKEELLLTEIRDILISSSNKK